MKLATISWKNILHKPLSTGLSLILLAFGVGIISLLLLLEQQVKSQFERNIKDIDMVLGAKGSPLQLILSSVYQVDAPTGNILLSDAQRVLKHPYIASGIPLAYGDSFNKFRIVGSDSNYLAHYQAQFFSGRIWKAPFEVVIGTKVAQESGLKVGDTFVSAHGLDGEGESHASHPFIVVGELAPSQSVLDQLILTPISSIWAVHEHDDEPFEKEITAMLLKKKSALAIVTLPGFIKNTNMQLALPAIEINRLNANFGIGMDTLRWVAMLIMFISFLSVFISLFNSLRERKYELALMRTMGASRSTLFQLIIQEGLMLSLSGFAIGICLSRIALLVFSHFVSSNFHYTLNQIGMMKGEVILFLITISVGALASFLPARRAMQIDISKTLSNA